ncbi:MAG TPA: alpha-amylase family glycosyl hydrolase, partial [Proteiniclasticum sp.]|nr:alpha-amylase family glycosyl hydrolase [Proteiniclasticum sp.]
YEYSYIVTYADGTTKEISDPKNTIDGISVIVYSVPKIDVTAEAYPSVIDYSENAVITITAEAENPVNLREAYLDLSAVGGKEKVAVDLMLMAHTISVKDSVTAGEKVIPVTLVDEFGNEHLSEVTLTVKARQILSENDFDWDEAMIYFMLTDRFNNGDETNDNPNGEDYNKEHLETYHGGDLKGITEKLDYIDNLGINTLWITPVVDNIDFNVAATWGGDLPENEKNQYAYHGYWAKDFEKLDEHLGSLEDFKELIDEAHERGIKIMLDVVVNHAGYGMRSEETNVNNLTNFPTEEEQAKFDGMFREPGQTDNIIGDLAGLPDFKTEDPLVRDTLVKWQTAWLERARTDKGNTIDYFRIDTVNNVEPTTLKALKNALTEIDPKFKSIGEAYGASINNDGGHLGTGQLDSVLDFSFKYSALNFVNGEIDGVETYLQEINDQINNTQTLGLFLGSHDEDGFLTRLSGTEAEKLAKLKAAAALQITAKGQPIIYYGEELGASGKAANNMDKVDGNFGENRYDMPWERLENMEYKAVHDHYQKLLSIRADYSKVFAKGTRTTLGGGDAEKYIVFNRSYNDKDLVVAINTDVEAKAVTVSVPFTAGTKVMDLYGDVEYTVGE